MLGFTDISKLSWDASIPLHKHADWLSEVYKSVAITTKYSWDHQIITVVMFL